MEHKSARHRAPRAQRFTGAPPEAQAQYRNALEMNGRAVKLPLMNFVRRLAALLLFAASLSALSAEARIVKVLPHFLDQNGKHTLHPSLFERDAYQAHLRTHPELCSGMRFDVQWKGRKLQDPKVKLEVRGAKIPARQIETFSRDLKSGGMFSRWAGVTVPVADFNRLGSIVAWRVSLWDGEQQLAEQKSFLW
jgi:hypothetical protein